MCAPDTKQAQIGRGRSEVLYPSQVSVSVGTLSHTWRPSLWLREALERGKASIHIALFKK